MGNFDRTRWFNSIFKMEVTTWLTVLLAVITLGTQASASEPRVVCYYTNWSVYRPGTARFNPQNINPYLCTHLIYAFGGFTKDNTLKPFDKYQDIEKGGYAKFTGLKTYNKNLKTLLAIGGWNEGSSRFSPMVGSRERRKEFVRNALKFLRQNRFDGLDLDWEYPAFRDGGKPKDRENYAKLVKELREEFEREAEKTGKPRLLLTMAVPAGIEYIEKGFDVKTLNQYLDWMNLLSYDYHSAFEPAVNHHAPLYPLEEPNEYSVDNELNIDYTIKFYLENGADPDKIVLGIPTYGRSYTLFNPEAFEIGSPADGPGEQGDATREKGYLAYYEICEALKPKTKKRETSDEDSDEEEDPEDQQWTVMYPNKNAMGPVAYKGNQWVGYDDIEIVKKKAEYVADNGLGGIMFWSIDNDDFRGACHDKPYPLIEAAKEAYFQKIGSTDNAVVRASEKAATRPSSRRNKPRTSSTTTTQRSTSAKSNKRTQVTSTTPAWNIITPEPPTTPDPGSDFKCVDEGFFPHPRDCKKYFWCLDSGPSNLGIVAHQFTCPSGLFFNKAADSCDFARNVLCKKPSATTKAPTKAPTTKAPTTEAPATEAPTTRAIVTTTRRPIKLNTKNSMYFRTTTTSTSTTTPKPEIEDELEDDSADPTDEDAEDPRVIKELIDLIKKVGGIEQLEKQLHLGETSASTDGVITTTPSSFNKKLYQKVLERTKAKNRFSSNSIVENTAQNSRRGPQNAGLEVSSDRDKLLRKDRPQYTTINRQRASTSTTESPDDEEVEEEPEEEVQQNARGRLVETAPSVATTARPLQYVNIRRARPTTLSTSDTADDSASRNALFERSEPLITVSDTRSSLDILNARRDNIPEYVTIRRQRPTTEENTTPTPLDIEEEEELEETALERELSAQPQYSSISRTRSTATPEEPSSETPFKIEPTPQSPSSPEPTTVLAVQISSLLNSPTSSEVKNSETDAPATEESTTTTTSRPTTTTTARATLPTRRAVIRRRGSTSTTEAPSTTQVPKRTVFLRRTKATAPPETETEPSTDKQGANKFTRRGSSKFKSRKEAELEKKVSDKNEVETRQPSLNDGSRRIERPTRKFVRRGGANATTTTTVAPSSQSTTAGVTRRPFRIASRRRLAGSTTTTSTTTPTTTSTQPTTNLYDDEESLQDIGDTDVIEDPTLDEKAPKDSSKVTRRPIINLKDEAKDQNPSATNEEETKRQSKKYSASIKQNQLNDLLKSKSQEETTENKTAEDITAETALALAAHQLITAPLPSITDFNEEDVTPTRKTQTTVEYKYTSREYNEYTGSQTPTYDSYQSTAVPISSLGNFDQTTVYKTDFDSAKVASTDFDVSKNQETSKYGTTPTAFPSDFSTYDSPKFSTTTYDARGTNFPNTASQDYIRTTDNAYTVSEYDSSKATPTSFVQTSFPSTGQYRNAGNTYANDYERVSNYLPKGTATTYPHTVEQYVPRLPSNSFQNSATREFSTDYSLPTITTSLSPPAPSQNRYFSRTPPSISDFENTARNVGFVPKSTESLGYSINDFATVPSLSVENTGYTGVHRGASRYRDNKVVVENYSTTKYTGAPQDALHTREYLLESPVTKSYDADYQYLSPATTPVTPATSRKIIRKKIQRKISTTLRPTTPIPSTTIKPRRASAKPFEKVSTEGKKKYRPMNNYDYYDDGDEKVATKYAEGTKVVMHENGNIECLDIGNFPHPTSCKKFISCARIENGSLLGWEYICPKGLSFDPVGGICNWSAGLGCNEKDV